MQREGRTQPATEMAHALETVKQDPILSDHPLLTATYGEYSYHIEHKGDESLYSVTDGSNTITMPIHWAVGAGFALGQTYILEKTASSARDGAGFENSTVLDQRSEVKTISRPICRKPQVD